MKFTLFHFTKEMVLKKSLKFLPYVLPMFLQVLGENQDIIQVDEGNHIARHLPELGRRWEHW